MAGETSWVLRRVTLSISKMSFLRFAATNLLILLCCCTILEIILEEKNIGEVEEAESKSISLSGIPHLHQMMEYQNLTQSTRQQQKFFVVKDKVLSWIHEQHFSPNPSDKAAKNQFLFTSVGEGPFYAFILNGE